MNAPGPTGKSIVRALLDPKPSRQSKRVKELWEVEAERDLLAVANGRQLAEIQRLSAELAAANVRITELERQANSAAQQRRLYPLDVSVRRGVDACPVAVDAHGQGPEVVRAEPPTAPTSGRSNLMQNVLAVSMFAIRSAGIGVT